MERIQEPLKVEFHMRSRVVERHRLYLIVEGICYQNPLLQRKCYIKITRKQWARLAKKNWGKVNLREYILIDFILVYGKKSIALFGAESFEKLSYRNLVYSDDSA
jgi:hypothetical protein